jgi:hypothetical protein
MMRITRRTLALAISASLTSLAALAPGAAAEAPEFGRCVKQASGNYANAGCTETAPGTGGYEWLPGPGPKPRFTEAVSGEDAFEWKLNSNEEHFCSGESATGEYTGAKTVAHVLIVLSGCRLYGEPCETINLEPMRGELGVYELGSTAAADKLGLKLTPENGEKLAEFDCPGANFNPYVWRGGSVIVPLTANKMLLKEALKYRERFNRHPTREEQVPASFVGESPDPLEGTPDGTSGEEKPFERMGWRMSPKLVNEERIEADSVV